jgi:serine/threonine-protein kinase
MQPGTRLDHYEIVGLLGEGGMGAVYRAEDTRLKRQVAIKVLPPELAADAERLARLEREAQLLASLNHTNVATIHGFGDVQAEIDGRQQRVTFLVMELIDGESLYDRAQLGPMPWREVVEIGIGIAAGLEAAHEKGIVHRDLKPANVHIAADGTVKVLDFGLAKAFDGEGQSGSLELSASPTMAAATRTGVILGTAAYMSPEQARGKTVDKRADIWALGGLLYELLAGKKAFEGETVSDILAAILKEQPNYDILPPIPESLRHVLERCLEKQPAQRMRDVGDVRIELEAARNEEARPTAAAAKSGLSWQLAVGVAVLAGLLGALAAIAVRSAPPTPPEAQVILSTDAIAGGPQPLQISPDARWIAEADPATGLRLRAMDEVRWRDIPDTEGVASVVFSADSQKLYFGRFAPETGLYQLDLDGTSPVFVASLPEGFPAIFRGIGGEIMVSTLADRAYTVSRLDSNGGITELGTGTLEQGSLLVSGQATATRWLGFQLASFAEAIGLVLIDLEAGTFTPFMPGYRSPLHVGDGVILAADAQGRLVSARINLDDGTIIDPPAVRMEGLSLSGGIAGAYSLADDGTFVFMAGESTQSDVQYLSWLSPSGEVERFSERGTQYQVDTFPSPDGTMVAAEFVTDVAANEVTIHIHDIERDISAPLVPGSSSSFPVWSPDSRQLAYMVDTGDAPGIYRAPVDRSELPTLLLAQPDGAFALPTDWSPDGSSLLYVLSSNRFRSSQAEVNDVWLLPLDGSEPRALVETPAREIDGRFSPDGRWFAYESDQDGHGQVFVRALTGGGVYQISADGGHSPEWNTAGDMLYFIHQGDIRAVDIDTSGATPNVSPERDIVALNGPQFRADLYAPWPNSDRFLVASNNLGDDAIRNIRAIFNWSFLEGLR